MIKIYENILGVTCPQVTLYGSEIWYDINMKRRHSLLQASGSQNFITTLVRFLPLFKNEILAQIVLDKIGHYSKNMQFSYMVLLLCQTIFTRYRNDGGCVKEAKSIVFPRQDVIFWGKTAAFSITKIAWKSRLMSLVWSPAGRWHIKNLRKN